MCTGSLMVREVSESAREIDCRIHHVAYVMNLNPLSCSNLSTARMSPAFPSFIRSRKSRPSPRYRFAMETTLRVVTVPYLIEKPFEILVALECGVWVRTLAYVLLVASTECRSLQCFYERDPLLLNVLRKRFFFPAGEERMLAERAERFADVICFSLFPEPGKQAFFLLEFLLVHPPPLPHECFVGGVCPLECCLWVFCYGFH
ncbi:MAG: hypothetical protein UY90_C0097G0003 [Candidatus Peregrinibacteria bacterium GW2011_GWA2_54_9]|nr:MAG: hypothetical protein UY90_C0097G0003 [Candidatus Peregrinibacteria bacterium GW2011_GWA2_54_9]